MSKPHWKRYSFFLVFALMFEVMLPTASAVVCQAQIMSIDYPSKVDPGVLLQVNASVKVTCTPTNDNVVVRVDVIALDSNSTLSRNSYSIGEIPVSTSSSVKVVNVTVSNTIKAPTVTGNWRLEAVAWVLAGPEVAASTKESFQLQVTMPTQATTTETTTGSASNVSTAVPLSLSTLEIIGLIVGVGLVVSVAMFMRRKKPQKSVLKEGASIEERKRGSPQSKAVVSVGPNISTGYSDLDATLSGGFPVGYAVLILSPPFDERDLLLRRIIETNLTTGSAIFFLSRDFGRTQDFVTRFRTNFYAFSPQADKITSSNGNVFKISGVQNLNDINISFAKAVATLAEARSNRIIIIDLLSDVLLEHQAVTTRKWLDDFMGKRKAEGFTVLAALNPLISTKQESQIIVDLFDGVVEIYEKQSGERARRFLIVRKMYGRNYLETELMLEKGKLF